MSKVAVYTALAIMLPCAASAQPTQPTLPTPFIVDRAGKVVGPFIYPDLVLLTLQPSQDTVAATVVAGGFPREGIQYFYPTKDCSGTKYLFFKIDTVVPHAIVSEDQFVYATQRFITIKENSISNGPRCFHGNFGPLIAAPVRQVPVTSQGFTPRFTVQLR